MMRNDSLVSKVSLKSMKIQRTNLTILENHNRNEVLRIARYPTQPNCRALDDRR